MKKLLVLCLALCMAFCCAAAYAEDVTLICDGTAHYKLEAEGRDMPFDGNYVFAQYFAGGTQEDMINGIKTLIADGAASINGRLIIALSGARSAPTQLLDQKLSGS